MSTQISANISDSTKTLVDAYVKRCGVKKGFLIEEALLHHLQALKNIPEDIIVPVKLLITEKSMENLADTLEQLDTPTKALIELMND